MAFRHGTTLAAHGRYLSAAANYDNAHDSERETQESREEAIESLVSDWNGDDAKRREAEEWTAGTFDGDHYTELTLALDELHRYGATVPVLNKLHALAKVESEALQGKMRDMAEIAKGRAA